MHTRCRAALAIGLGLGAAALTLGWGCAGDAGSSLADAGRDPADGPGAALDAGGLDAPVDAIGDGMGDTRVVAPHPFLAPGLQTIAHRGGGRLAPEHTLVAYQNAVDLGIDVLEVDLHLTADGELVCLHDGTVNRTTDGSGAIAAMTLAEARTLDAGYHFSPDGGATHPYRGAGVRIPTFGEVLATFPDTPFSVELKADDPNMVEAVSSALDAADAGGRVVLVSFHDWLIQALRAARPELVTAMGLAEMAELALLAPEDEARYVPPCEYAQLNYAGIDEAMMARARRLGLRVQAWTVNDAAEMQRLLDLEVDGIMTDDPALLLGVLQGRSPPR